MLEDLTVSREAIARTVRLVATARLRAAVLAALTDSEEEHLLLAELEGATSARLLTEARGHEGLPMGEFVHGVPHAKFVNAAFAYARPGELNRFNGPTRGAWYCALAVETALAEVTFHMTDFLEKAGDFHAVVDYAELFASLAGEYLDLRAHPDHACLGREPMLAYPAGNALAQAVRLRGLNGIIYPSVRQTGGTCFAVLWPHAVQSVAQGEALRLTWQGDRQPMVGRAPA